MKKGEIYRLPCHAGRRFDCALIPQKSLIMPAKDDLATITAS
jgi:hypothetical protein